MANKKVKVVPDPPGTIYFISEENDYSVQRTHGKFNQQLLRDILDKEMDGEAAAEYLDAAGVDSDASLPLSEMVEDADRLFKALALNNQPCQYRGEQFIVGFAFNAVDAAVWFSK